MRKKTSQSRRRSPQGKKTRPVFTTDRAQILLVRRRSKLRALRLSKEGGRARESAEHEFNLQKIFHLVFPENSIKPIEVARVMVEGKPRWGTVSEVLRQRSQDYKLAQRWFYASSGRWPKINDPEKEDACFEASLRHKEFVDSVGMKAASKIEKAGFSVYTDSVNVCNAGGRPVFFGVMDTIRVRSLENYLKKTADEDTRAKVQALLKKLPARWKS